MSLSKSRNLVLYFLCLNFWSLAHPPDSRVFDILNYQFDITLNDSSNRIQVDAVIDLKILDSSAKEITLDFANESKGVGMIVSDVAIDGRHVRYSHDSDLLKISIPKKNENEDLLQVTIRYAGIPGDGLVISQNKHGQRTFFAEHWPDRAHHWLPVVDHPSEKATCEFIVTAPTGYQIIANGELQKTELISDQQKMTAWKMDQPISPKVMVIGAAPFVTHTLDATNHISAWVYKKTPADALKDFEKAPEIYEMLTDFMGKYPFSKCDQVESSTRFGGMENAGNIFYPESSLTGEQKINATIAHEIAHQWFGNSVTEADWPHLWISEGFATFFENYWVEMALGQESLMVKLEEEEKKVMKFQKQNPGQKIIQTRGEDLNLLMNAMTYDKAGWMLRMLRYKVGEEVFKRIVLDFYQQFKYSTASSQDFETVAQKNTPMNLVPFFKQWLYTPGVPETKYNWSYEKNNLVLTFNQQGENVYQLDFDLQLTYKDGSTANKRISIDERVQRIEIPTNKPKKLVIDPTNIILGNFYEQ